MRNSVIVGAYLLLISMASCTAKNSERSKGNQVEVYTADANAVAFDLDVVNDSSCPKGDTCFMARHERQGAIAKFRIEFEPAAQKINVDFITASGKGRIVALEGSNSALLLQELKTSLEAKSLPKKVTRKRFIAFEYAEMGNRLSHDPKGGLRENPSGNWSANKLFFGDDEGEVFLNVNPVLRKGEFSIKDADYGDYLLKEFAKVL